jgi:hypothetical protein
MGILGLFAIAARNLRNHYLGLANIHSGSDRNNTYNRAKWYPRHIPEVNVDRWEPSLQAQNIIPNNNVPTEQPKSTEPEAPLPDQSSNPVDSESKPEVQPESTYFFRRKAHLDYQLDLRFDLHAITQTVQQFSEGDLEALEELTAANFGLAAAMGFKGKQVVETNMPEVEGEALPPTQTNERSLTRAHQVQHIAVQSRNFALRAFHHEATHTMKSLKVTEQDGYRRTVNKFAYRFTMDSRLSFAFLERFNVQTQDVAEQMPESLGDYLTSAGNTAEKATPEIIGAFFDAVDAYLEGAEEQIIEKVNQFFDMAAEELGLSDELVDVARDHLLETIESFFNQVDNALADLESRFVPSDLVQPTLPAGEPEILPAEYENPAVSEKKAEIAVA